MIREREYDYCINLIGDVRENLIGILSGATHNIAPVWASGHLFKNKMTDVGAAYLLSCGISIPAAMPNFYQSMAHFAAVLGLPPLEGRKISTECSSHDPPTIALHPGASHPSRHWPMKNWQQLAKLLHRRGWGVIVLGAPEEHNTLAAVFDSATIGFAVEVATHTIHGFASRLAQADALIGMDSFSAHAAYALGVPSVVLNGSADASIFTPPGSVAVSAGHLCNDFPCYYDYPCAGHVDEYICSRGIQCHDVLNALSRITPRRDASTNSVHDTTNDGTETGQFRILKP